MSALIKRIVVFGIESTGKTSLAQRLAAHFGEPWAPEFVREFWDMRDGKIVAEDLGTIALGQLANEDLAMARAQRVAFFDTDLLTCTLWNDTLFPGRCPAWVQTEAEERARSQALYLLCDADAPFAPDPQRCFADAGSRAEAARIWRAALVSRGLPFDEIRGDWPERERTAIAAVEAVLARGLGST
ncbi:MAG: N-acetylglucosamine-6-sulfatase [Opitutus sp.]|nr:N-acetylglucosamine-6-sulfatase [Opitutus sp.]